MSDSKFFSTTKKGEIPELRSDLQGENREKKKDAVKKVIANMTVGKDVSMLFPDVINCMQTDDVELKKLVYLYLMNYAKSQPDMAIMAVNTFVKDCEHPNPLVRALAVRTMGCIRVEKITEYLCQPLRKCLEDSDPYVRKTAAVCVAKLHDLNAALVEDQGFLDIMRNLLSDSNPMVVANTVAALSEIAENSGSSAVFELTSSMVNKLLTAVNDCTEWGQVFILDSLALYIPKDAREAWSIAERVTPRLSHANAAVVLSAVKVLLKLMDRMGNESDAVSGLVRKLAPPLITLLAAHAEVQYVALRNINLVVQKRPEVLQKEVRMFFVKYNDPIYVKLEKLDIMLRLTSGINIGQVLPELKEYASEVDVDFVRKAVRAIGRCAIKVETARERCVSTLMDLINTKVNYVVQEAVVVIKDIFRKYPNRYENIISTLCENLDSLDEPEAKAAMIWILGEYAGRIDNAAELLESFVDNFSYESAHVQLQLLTAVVKLFLLQPSNSQELVQTVLSLATQESDNPDLRDRAYIYWRLLSTDPSAAKDVVLSEKPIIAEDSDLLESTVLDELISYLSTLASVYHKPPGIFIKGAAPLPQQVITPITPKPQFLLDLDDGLLALSPAAASPLTLRHEVWLSSQKGNGLEVSGTLARRGGQIFMDMTFTNHSFQPLGIFAIQLNKNSFALAPAAPLQVIAALPPSQSHHLSLPLNTLGPVQRMEPLNVLQVALKTSLEILYFSCSVPYHVLFVEDGKMDRKVFLVTWKDIDVPNEVQVPLDVPFLSTEQAELKLAANNVFTVDKRKVDDTELVYMTMKLTNGIWLLVELKFQLSTSQVHLALKTRSLEVVPGVQAAITDILVMV